MSKKQNKLHGLDPEAEARVGQASTVGMAYHPSHPPLQPNTESLVGRAYGIASDIDTLASHTRDEVQYLRGWAESIDQRVVELKQLATNARSRANEIESQLTK